MPDVTANDQHNPPAALDHPSPETTGTAPGAAAATAAPSDAQPGAQPGAGETGRAYWRSLEEYADSAEFRDMLGRAGMPIDEQQLKGVSRRRFLQLMAASMSLAGLTLTGCRRLPQETIAPFAERPEGRVPGEPTYYATMMEQAGVAMGLLAESYDGRPIKLEGNPRHPYANGATDIWSQASVLTLYDPDRSRHPRQLTEGGGRRNWQHFRAFADEHFDERTGAASAGIAVLGAPTSSSTMRRAQQQFQQRFPESRWYQWEPINRDKVREGLRLAFGTALREQLHLDRARVVACFDADPLGRHPAGVRHQHDWASLRRTADEGEMSRVYVAEPSFTSLGSVADERLPVRSSHVPQLIATLAARLGVDGESASREANGGSRFIEMLAADLEAHPGESLVVVGEDQPAETQALAWAINERLGNIGETVLFTVEPDDDEPPQLEQLRELVQRIEAGEVDTLVILGSNPVYDAPADLNFGDALARVETKIHHGLYVDETALACDWHLPAAHYLESWGDGRAWDGTLSVQQPMILPLFEGRSAIEVIAELAGEQNADGQTLVREAIEATGADWRTALHLGLVEASAADAQPRRLQEEARALGQANGVRPEAAEAEFEVIFRPDAKVYDGRWANNGWLQELPGPLTKLTWDNAALMSVTDAGRLGVKEGDMVALNVGDRTLEMPCLPMPGQAEGAVVVSLGYGRRATGHVGTDVGFDTYTLRTSEAMHVAGARLTPSGAHYELATTTNHDLVAAPAPRALDYRVGEQAGSGTIVRSNTLEGYQRDPHFVEDKAHGDISLQLYDPPKAGEWREPAWDGAPAAFNEPHAWGMAVDMNACTGCSACMIACQSENNVPVVGKHEVRLNREMHWLRIDRYFRGDPEGSPDVVHQPMMCVHCENAPCEQVCPVNASLHDSEGLNLQVYNRCVGTRYCSNNCPYKVRRFNFLDYHSQDPRGGRKPWLDIPDQQQREQIDRVKAMVFNPDVTVRMRGVMEKCTYCIQRISRAKIAAKNEHARGERAEPTVQDGEVVTACQSACPSQAIVFGDLNDPNSRVSQLHRNDRAYKVLGPDLNTRPRTAHLAKISNPRQGVET